MIYTETSFCLRISKWNAWERIAELKWLLQVMKKMGYLMKNAITRAFKVGTCWPYSLTTSSLWELIAPVHVLQPPPPSPPWISNVTLAGICWWQDKQNKQQFLCNENGLGVGGVSIFSTHHHSVLDLSTLIHSFHLPHCIIMKNIPDIMLGWIVKLLRFEIFRPRARSVLYDQLNATLSGSTSVPISKR